SSLVFFLLHAARSNRPRSASTPSIASVFLFMMSLHLSCSLVAICETLYFTAKRHYLRSYDAKSAVGVYERNLRAHSSWSARSWRPAHGPWQQIPAAVPPEWVGKYNPPATWVGPVRT